MQIHVKITKIRTHGTFVLLKRMLATHVFLFKGVIFSFCYTVTYIK